MSFDESERLVNYIDNDNITASNTGNTNRPNSKPIPANRLALEAQIQAAANHQRKLRARRRIYYIILITSCTMITLFILSFVAWIIHNSSNAKIVGNSSLNLIEGDEVIVNYSTDIPVDNEKFNSSTLNARKHPTRTIFIEKDNRIDKKLFKRSEMESDEEKDVSDGSLKNVTERRPTRTRKLSFAPEKIIDYKPEIQN